MKTSDILPLTPHEPEFSAWVADARRAGTERSQGAIDELIAEHHMMDVVLAAMDREARKLGQHQLLRLEFWEDVVDWTGNYVHQCHRRKEEEALFPVMLSHVGADQQLVEAIAAEHRQAKQLTLDLLDGVDEGDWEKVLRAAHLYVRLAREHLVREQTEVFEPAVRLLDAGQHAALRRAFDAIERDALGDRDRLYYLEVARRLARGAALPDLILA